jgi:hypothetical protein
MALDLLEAKTREMEEGGGAVKMPQCPEIEAEIEVDE